MRIARSDHNQSVPFLGKARVQQNLGGRFSDRPDIRRLKFHSSRL